MTRRAPATGGTRRDSRSLVASTATVGHRWLLWTPYPPSTNNLYMTIGKRRVKTQAARDFTETVRNLALVARTAHGTPSPPYRLTIDLWAPDLRRRDADNGVKCLMDALLKATGHDDAEVVDLHVVKRGVDRVRPRAVVTLDHVAPSHEDGEG